MKTDAHHCPNCGKPYTRWPSGAYTCTTDGCVPIEPDFCERHLKAMAPDGAGWLCVLCENADTARTEHAAEASGENQNLYGRNDQR